VSTNLNKKIDNNLMYEIHYHMHFKQNVYDN
jgi:hypothetical protein